MHSFINGAREEATCRNAAAMAPPAGGTEKRSETSRSSKVRTFVASEDISAVLHNF